jgi:hypothetical protein
MIVGVISEAGPPPAQFRQQVKTFVVNVNWSDLQASPGSPISSNNAIDRAIASARQLGMTIKVRLLTGIHSPTWAKEIDGPAITIHAPVDNITGTIGRFWTDDFGRAYDDLVNKLAAEYDSVPEIREVTVSRCMTVYAEPFIRDAADPGSVQALLAAGFSVQADTACQREQIDANKAWITTRSGVAFSTYEHINPDGSAFKDEAFTEQMMAYCRQTLGAGCVLENNGITANSPTSGVYQIMKQMGPPISFQAAGLAKVKNLDQTVSLAVSIGATSVEVLPTMLHLLSDLSTLDQDMSANAARGPG